MTAAPRVAIVSMGAILPTGPTPEDLWRAVLAGDDVTRDVPADRWLLSPDDVVARGGPYPDKVFCRRGGFLEEVPALELPKEMATLGPACLLAVAAGRQAWQAAITSTLDCQRVGVILGNIALPTEEASALARAWLGRTFAEQAGWCAEPAPFTRPPGYETSLPARVLARALGLGGGAFTLDAACASSLVAIKLAADALRSGRLDTVLAGGVSRPDCLHTQMGFSQLRALSPGGRCRPLDASADGLIVGEGAGIFMLKRLDDALGDGDQVLAVLAGEGLSNDVAGGLLAPASEGQLRAMREAYRRANWSPADVDLIECHATGTPLGDQVELESLRALWEQEQKNGSGCVLGSVKSTVGHLLTAAGAASLVKVLCALRDGLLPPTANFSHAARALADAGPCFRVLQAPQAWARRGADQPRRAAISGFGFGGINAHLLVEEWLPQPRRVTCPCAPAQPRTAPAIAVVAMEACFGPWRDLRSFQHRVLGGAAAVEPSVPTHWWGVEQSKWFQTSGLNLERFRGHYLQGPLKVAAGRFRVPPHELRAMLPQQLLMLLVADTLLRPMRLTELTRLRTGTYLGLGIDLNTTNFHLRWSILRRAKDEAAALGLHGRAGEDWLRQVADAAGPPLDASRTVGALGSIVASRIARELRLGGPALTVCEGAASGLRAIEIAARALENNEIDCALAGAVDLAGDVRAVLASHSTRPGVLPGEGAAAVVLKRLEDARRDGDPVITVLRGIGSADDFETLCAQADTAPESIAYIEDVSEEGPAQECKSTFRVGTVISEIGHAGAAAGMAAFVKACLCLDRQVLPQGPQGLEDGGSLPQYWARDRAAGPRRAGVRATDAEGAGMFAVLEAPEHDAAADRPDRLRPLAACPEAIFVVEGTDIASLIAGLRRLRAHAGQTWSGLEAAARAWALAPAPDIEQPLAVALVARSLRELLELIHAATVALEQSPGRPLPDERLPPGHRDRIYYSPTPLGPDGQVAFVYPGSGNAFEGMGRDVALYWPEVLRRQDAENCKLRSQLAADVIWGDDYPGALTQRLLAQVALGCVNTDLLRGLGIQPGAAFGYSLGESAALFALRAWTDRDRMLAALAESPLFETELGGPCEAARRAWGLPTETTVRWSAGLVDRSAAEVRSACEGVARAYLLAINSPRECVIGGDANAVGSLVRRLGCRFVPATDSSTMHCPIPREVAQEYRQLHLLPLKPPDGVRFYSTALGRSYDLDSESAADAILAQALDTIDFQAVVEAAYRDGVRYFVEIGPGASCTRMIATTLEGRPHLARSVCAPGRDGVSLVLQVLAHLAAERLPIDFKALYRDGRETVHSLTQTPSGKGVVEVPIGGDAFAVAAMPPPAPSRHASESPARVGRDDGSPEPSYGALAPELVGALSASAAVADAHAAYLRLDTGLTEQVQRWIAFQTGLLEKAVSTGTTVAVGPPCAREHRGSYLDRDGCLAFARGTIESVLGPAYAAVDEHPTRVRLPDEPLMLVDRVLSVDGEPRSLGAGRVVTEHDVIAGAWYLDGERAPTCIAVEAGQADLFLSGYLGIDFHTRGLAVYRLLDAVVVFHRGLPRPGETIRYDIHIDQFFRQGQTRLFRFRFEGSIDGRPLLSMRDGCAGFFTQDELAAGRGVVQRAMDSDRRPGKRAPGEEALVNQMSLSLADDQVDALRAGELEAAFGAAFAGKSLAPGLRLPDGRLRLVHRVPTLDPGGGRFGIGLVRAEADVHPDDWFLTCHFVDDPVMPGTLMYECCLHTARIFLLRMGWVGSETDIACEPVPGVASRLRCRGQVTPQTHTVSYEVAFKERGYRPEAYALADAIMYADGKPIVEITDLSIRFTGLTREQIEATWSGPEPVVAYPKERILAFAVGKPSEAFGEPYRVFDSQRLIARLPGPPFQFLDRIIHVEGEPWRMAAGAVAVAEYDVPPDAWYFAAERAAVMPFSVLLETALQPCGWLAAYVGSALTSADDLCFRNLGGDAVIHAAVGPDAEALRTRARLTEVSSSGGMILQHYEFAVSRNGRKVYTGTTSFGFFTRVALAQQVGVRGGSLFDASPAERARSRSFAYPPGPPFPDRMLRMLDEVELLVPDGGPAGLGFAQGSKRVDPHEWFFQAHFFQDPVWPGSLGLEAFLQLMKVLAADRWGLGPGASFTITPGSSHRWQYRGQVIPVSKQVTVQVIVTAVGEQELTADGWLSADGKVIYRMSDFRLTAFRGS